MLKRIAEVAGLLALGCVAQAAQAENFDYDSRRPAELRACDDPRDHGKAPEAKACYQKLLNASRDPATQAEAAWAIGDVKRANELFRAAVQADDQAVRSRVRWGLLYLDTHQFSDAGDLFKEAIKTDPDDRSGAFGDVAADGRAIRRRRPPHRHRDHRKG
ncbi:MAG: hypothetical protein WDO68_31365 [Gammaproteobacteria bacterium]